MPTIVTSSDNIASLDSLIIGDTCAGNIVVDVSPTTYIGSGSNNVLGANIKITNPLGVVIKEHPTSGYEIEGGSPPMLEQVEVAIPTTAGNYQYGNYTIEVTMYDADGTEYVIEKSIYIANPDSKNKTKKYANITATIKGLCRDGKAIIQVATPPSYRGNVVESQDSEFVLEYPTGSELDPIETGMSAFSVPLYEGVYKISGETCATYNYGDNVYAKVKYKLKYEKKISCILNYECIGIYLASLQDKVQSNCTEEEENDTIHKISKIVGLVATIEYLADNNLDASDYVNQLEALIECSCTCEGIEGTPIINNSPSTDVVVEGVNVSSETTGLTTTYTIDNYDFEVSVYNNNGGVLTVSSVIVDGTVKKQVLILDVSKIEELIEQSVAISESENGIVDVPYTSGAEYDHKFALGGSLIRDTTIAGAYLFLLSQGKLKVTHDSTGNAFEAQNANQVDGNAIVTYGAGIFQRNITIDDAIGKFTNWVIGQLDGNSQTVAEASITSAECVTLVLNNLGTVQLNPLSVIGGHVATIQKVGNADFVNGTISNYTASTTLAGVGDFDFISAFRAIPPLQEQPAEGDTLRPYTGTVTKWAAILIESSSVSDLASQITAFFGIYQKGTDHNYIAGKTIFAPTYVAPTSQVDINGANGYSQLRLRQTYTPTGTADANGQIGDVCFDDSYGYRKTSVGWKKWALSPI